MFAILVMSVWPMMFHVHCVLFFHWSAGGEEGDVTDGGGQGAVTSPGEPGQKIRSRTRKRHSLANKPQDFQVRDCPVVIKYSMVSILNADCLCLLVILKCHFCQRSVCGWLRDVSCLEITSNLWSKCMCAERHTGLGSGKEITHTLMRYKV